MKKPELISDVRLIESCLIDFIISQHWDVNSVFKALGSIQTGLWERASFEYNYYCLSTKKKRKKKSSRGKKNGGVGD